MRTVFVLILGSFSSLWAQGQYNDTLSYTTKLPIVIEVDRLPTPLNSVAAPVNLFIPDKAYQKSTNLSIKEKLLHSPGLQILNTDNFAQDARISIRGYGARAAFGIRGIQIYLDDIPLTTPDGQTQLDNVDLNLLSKIEVNKGSSSGVYGNAAGGVISMTTIDSIADHRLLLSSTFGNFGLSQQGLTFSESWKNHQLLLSYNRLEYDGYREHTAMRQQIINMKYKLRWAKRHQLSVGANYVDAPLAKDPGSLNLESVIEDGQQANARNQSFDAGETIDQLTTSIKYDLNITKNTSWKSVAYLVSRDFDNKLPFTGNGSVGFDRIFWGHYSRLHYRFNDHHRLLLSYDFRSQSDDRKLYDNNDGIRGDLQANQLQTFNNSSLSGQYEYHYNDWQINSALRYDNISIASEDRLSSTPSEAGSISYNRLNYQLALLKPIHTNHTVFARVATSFETPSLTELANNPDGTLDLNEMLLPQRSLSFDLGYRSINFNRGNLELNSFVSRTKDEISPYEISAFPGRNFYRNTGSSLRVGVEADASFYLSDHFTIKGSFAWIDASFTSDIPENNIVKGNRLPGIASTQSALSLQYKNRSLESTLSYRHLGEMALDDANTAVASPGQVWSGKLSYSLSAGKTKLYPSLALINIFNTETFQNLRINAFGQRYYEGAAPRQIRVGLAVGI